MARVLRSKGLRIRSRSPRPNHKANLRETVQRNCQQIRPFIAVFVPQTGNQLLLHKPMYIVLTFSVAFEPETEFERQRHQLYKPCSIQPGSSRTGL